MAVDDLIEVRAEDVRAGDWWHVFSPAGCDGDEEFAVTAVRPFQGEYAFRPDVLIYLNNGIDAPMRFRGHQGVLVHRAVNP